MIYGKLGVSQGQGTHRKTHAVIVNFFYKNKTLSGDDLEARVHLHVSMSYTSI